jgi:hypothetical protein
LLRDSQEDMRETSLSELVYEDLEKLPPDDVIRIAAWLTEKVDALSGRLKAEQRVDEVRPAAAAVQWSAYLWLAGQRFPGCLCSGYCAVLLALHTTLC